jgi:hypothetical protein
VSPLELVDDRFEKLAWELRTSRPVASEALRARVAELGPAQAPVPRWTFRLPSRRLVLGLAAAALLVSFVAAGVAGLTGSGKKHGSTVGARGAPAAKSSGAGALQAPEAPRAAPSFGAVTVAPQRLQRYDATLRLRVENVDTLSSGAQRAMNLTRSLGGYVASVNYATHGGQRGGATLVLRVPLANIQTALAELTSLGTILQQHTALLDVTKRADREARQIATLERELAQASSSERPALEARLRTLRAKHSRLLRSARLARIVVTLTTAAPQAAAPPGRIRRTLDDAGTVLVRELEILLYALVVAGPLLLLGGAAIAAARAQRRRSDRRLLERA